MLEISPTTGREYRRALEAAGLLPGAPEEVPELDVLQAALTHRRRTSSRWVLPPEVPQEGLAAFKRIGEEVSRVIKRRPESLVVVRIVRPFAGHDSPELRRDRHGLILRARSSCSPADRARLTSRSVPPCRSLDEEIPSAGRACFGSLPGGERPSGDVWVKRLDSRNREKPARFGPGNAGAGVSGCSARVLRGFQFKTLRREAAAVDER